MYILSSSYSVNSLLFSFKNISIHDFSFVILSGYSTIVTGESKMQPLRETEKEKKKDRVGEGLRCRMSRQPTTTTDRHQAHCGRAESLFPAL